MQEPMNRIGDLLKACQARIALGAIQTVAVVSLLVLALLALLIVPRNGESVKLTSDLFPDQRLTTIEIQRIETALGQTQLANYQVKEGSICVPQALRGAYLAAIAEAGALPDFFHGPTDDAISNASVMETSLQRSQRLHHALEKEARLAICALPGVLDAFVHIDVGTDSSLHRKTKATAVVGVKTTDDQPLDEQSFRTIQAMLLNFKTGLTPDSVTVTDLTSRRFFRGSIDQQSPAAVATMRKADLEHQWIRRLASAISFVPDAHLTVNVVPSTDGSRAESVTCSISIPQAISDDRSDSENDQFEENLRRRVQAAVLPLLPRQNERVDDLIAVTVFDQHQLTASAVSTNSHLKSTNLLALVLIAIAGLMALLLIRNTFRTPPREASAQLRIYEEQDSGTDNLARSSASEHLQTMAAEDPRAVAASLSDFIDRAS